MTDRYLGPAPVCATCLQSGAVWLEEYGSFQCPDWWECWQRWLAGAAGRGLPDDPCDGAVLPGHAVEVERRADAFDYECDLE